MFIQKGKEIQTVPHDAKKLCSLNLARPTDDCSVWTDVSSSPSYSDSNYSEFVGFVF